MAQALKPPTLHPSLSPVSRKPPPIAEYLASVEGGSFDADAAEGLMFNLEESDVVAVTSHEPGGQEEIQYFYEFLVEPNFTMSG